MACPLLRYAKQRWGNLDACSYHVLTTVELPEDPKVATQVLRRLETAFIESAVAREQPLQNKNRPLCQCERTRLYQQEWRARCPPRLYATEGARVAREAQEATRGD